MERYDPDAYDREMYLCALDRLEAQMNMARISVAEAMAAEFGGYEGTLNDFLCVSGLYDPGEAFCHLRDYEPEIKPDAVHHSGDIPETIPEKVAEDGDEKKDKGAHIHKIGSVA